MAISLWFEDYESVGGAEAGQPRRVLITGAAGLVGGLLIAAARERTDLRLRLMVETEAQRDAIEGVGDADGVVVGDLRDEQVMRRAVEDIDTVVNLAAASRASQPWEEVHGPNIVGPYAVLEAAAEAGCRRVVLASSVNAIGGCGDDNTPIHEEQAIAPANVYGASKAFNEAIGYHFARQHGLSVLCVRLGGVCDREKAARAIAKDSNNARLLISHEDTTQIFLRCIDDTRVHFGIFHAASDLDNPIMDTTRAREVLGFQPTRLTAEGTESSPTKAAAT